MRFYLAGVEINYTFARSFVVDINQESERRMNYFFKITMKKVLLSLTFMALAMTMMAIPAKRGVTKMLTLADGTTVKAQLVGDEHGHYWKAEDGKAYTQINDNKPSFSKKQKKRKTYFVKYYNVNFPSGLH